PTPARAASIARASRTPTSWVVATKSTAVPPAPQAWQCQRGVPLRARKIVTGGVRPVWGPWPGSGHAQLADRPRPARGPSTSSASAARSTRSRIRSRSKDIVAPGGREHPGVGVAERVLGGADDVLDYCAASRDLP